MPAAGRRRSTRFSCMAPVAWARRICSRRSATWYRSGARAAGRSSGSTSPGSSSPTSSSRRCVSSERLSSAPVPRARHARDRRRALSGGQEGHAGRIPAHVQRDRVGSAAGGDGLGRPSSDGGGPERAVGQSVRRGDGGSGRAAVQGDADRDSSASSDGVEAAGQRGDPRSHRHAHSRRSGSWRGL